MTRSAGQPGSHVAEACRNTGPGVDKFNVRSCLPASRHLMSSQPEKKHIILQTLVHCGHAKGKVCLQRLRQKLGASGKPAPPKPGENRSKECGAFEQMAVSDMETIIIVCDDKQEVVMSER